MAYTPTLGIPTFGVGDLGYIEKPRYPFVLNKQSDQANGLVGWYPMEPGGGKKCYDLSGNNNHGTLTGFDFTSTNGWRNGNNGGRSLQFTTTMRVVAGSAARISPPFPLSLVTWAKFVATPAAFAFLAGNSDSTGNIGFRFDHEGGGDIRFSVNTYTNTAIFTPVTFTGAWHMFVGTYDGATIRIYADGVPGGTFSYSTAVSYNGASMLIGSPGNGWGNLSGWQEDTRVYNRCLSATEVAALYDPRTRWELRYQPGQRLWFLPEAAGVVTAPMIGPYPNDQLYKGQLYGL